MHKALRHRPKAVEIGGIAGRRQSGQSAAMNAPSKPISVTFSGCAIGGVIFPHGLDHAFGRFCAGIAEKNQIGKTRRAQRVGQRLLFGNAIEVETCHSFSDCACSAAPVWDARDPAC